MNDSARNPLILITANSKMISTFDEFQYPESGEFNSDTDLSGLYYGKGNSDVLDFHAMKWVVLKASVKDITFHDNEFVTFKKGSVVHVGSNSSATQYLYDNGGKTHYIYGLVIFEGDDKIIKAGDNAYINCGKNCLVVAGKNSSIWAGNNSKVKTGCGSTIVFEDTSSCYDGCSQDRLSQCCYNQSKINSVDYYSTSEFYSRDKDKIYKCSELNNLEKYLFLESERVKVTQENNYRESIEEERILDKMDDVWWNLTDEEKKLVDPAWCSLTSKEIEALDTKITDK